MPPPQVLIDITQVAEAAGLPVDAALVLLEMHGQQPAAKYRGRPLWLSDSVHALLERQGQVPR